MKHSARAHAALSLLSSASRPTLEVAFEGVGFFNKKFRKKGRFTRLTIQVMTHGVSFCFFEERKCRKGR
jgi:hypothetical protein